MGECLQYKMLDYFKSKDGTYNMQNKRVCNRCVMDDISDRTITFDENGFCNYCTDTLKRIPLEYFPNEAGKKILDTTMLKIKKESINREYDCMVGVSGGLDSSYVIYLGYQYGLRMLAIHVDDGLDTETAKKNIIDLCSKANVKLIMIKPDKGQFADLTLSLIKASVPNLAMAQDSILVAALNDTAKKYDIKYSLSGGNFSHECILERGNSVNYADKKHLMYIHKKFGTCSIKDLRLISFWEKYIFQKYFGSAKNVYPLNYIDYNLKNAINGLSEFSGYNYYGGKHYESILTRFLQCYYLPVKYGIDKRKSHFSSMIVSGQMTREEALERLKEPPYANEELKEYDSNFLANYFNISREEFDRLIELPAKKHRDYPVSSINGLSGIARKFRRYLG